MTGVRPGLVRLGVPGFVVEADLPVPCGIAPDEYFAKGTRPAQARELCSGCGYLEACRAYAMARPGLWGVWGGTTRRERERRQVRAERSPPAVRVR
ncbi:WhiB family transcriptional regulator [Streptomyces sp. NPDC001604]|uniref:WhiB family transcriptional regulator n=1 Tax=Streptomyces sp. NPDC001604 TaxID=3364593 RepID=UPI0036C82488